MNPPIEVICNQMILWGYELGVVSTRLDGGFYPSLGLRVFPPDTTFIQIPVGVWRKGTRTVIVHSVWGDIRPLEKDDDIDHEQYLALYEYAKSVRGL